MSNKKLEDFSQCRRYRLLPEGESPQFYLHNVIAEGHIYVLINDDDWLLDNEKDKCIVKQTLINFEDKW